MTRTFSTVLNKTGHPCLVDFRGSTFSFSLLSMVLAVCLYMAFVRLKHVPSTLTWLSFFFSFYHKWMLNYFRNFSAYMEMIIRFSLWFGITLMLATWMSSEAFLPLQFSGRVWEGLVLIFFWMFGRIHQWSHLVLDFCFLEVFGYWFSLLEVIDLFRLFFKIF